MTLPAYQWTSSQPTRSALLMVIRAAKDGAIDDALRPVIVDYARRAVRCGGRLAQRGVEALAVLHAASPDDVGQRPDETLMEAAERRLQEIRERRAAKRRSRRVPRQKGRWV